MCSPAPQAAVGHGRVRRRHLRRAAADLHVRQPPPPPLLRQLLVRPRRRARRVVRRRRRLHPPLGHRVPAAVLHPGLQHRQRPPRLHGR